MEGMGDLISSNMCRRLILLKALEKSRSRIHLSSAVDITPKGACPGACIAVRIGDEVSTTGCVRGIEGVFRQRSRRRGRQVEIQLPFFAQEHLPQVPEWVHWQHVIVDNRMTKGGHTCRLPSSHLSLHSR